jgi:hypothetical protein
VLVWLHRRRRRAVTVTVPSVLFLGDEGALPAAPQRRRLDPDLLLALAATTALALAAAGPAFARPAGLVVRLVTDLDDLELSQRPTGRSWQERIAELERVRAAARRHGDRLDEIHASVHGPDLTALAQRGSADVRIVVTDRAPSSPAAGVRVVCVGLPGATNAGIVAAGVTADDPPRGFATVLRDGPDPLRGTLTIDADAARTTRTLELPAWGARSITFPIPRPAPTSISLEWSPRGDLQGDDHVSLRPDVFRVAFGTGAEAYPEPYRRAVLDGLRVAAGSPASVVDGPPAELYVGPLPVPAAFRGTTALVLHPLRGAAGVRSTAPARTAPVSGSVIDPTGCDLVYAPGVDSRRLFATQGDDGVAVWDFLPDPLAGSPAPVDHPVWPLFLDAVRTTGDRRVERGWRVHGVLDPDLTRVGRDVIPFDPTWIEGAPRRVERRSLRDEALGAGAACLVLLWSRAAFARRRAVP